MGNKILEAALSYAKRGWPVLPLHTPQNGKCSCRKNDCTKIGKHPRYDKGLIPNGLKDASTDPEIIKKWWGIWPDANIGIRTGQVSGLFVLDVDAKNSGLETIRQLEQRFGALPATSKVRTGGGGLHYFFQYPGNEVRSVAGLWPGIDIRANGGYVVAPPSLHKSGKEYEFIKEITNE
jgi:putative DNA primase/helicase